MANKAAERTLIDRSEAIASRLVDARLKAMALSAFPVAQPDTLEAAYQCQESAITIWPDEIAGWKIGRLAPDQEATFGQMRLSGPIFRGAVRLAQPDVSTPFPVFQGGFAAVESEFVFRLGRDAPADKEQWSLDDAAEMVATLHIGVETAGSPMAAINDLGCTAVISDFGNNAGLILGPEISGWRARTLESLACVTSIDGHEVGRGNAVGIPGGPIEALRFILAHCAERGRPLKTGMYISTGAVTGIHAVVAGQSGISSFGKDGRILCHAIQAKPMPTSST